MAVILECRDLTKYFRVGRNKQGPVYLRAVDGVSFEVQEGETLGLVGESGSGKSTLAYTIVGMYRPTGGHILFRGQDIGMEADRRSMALKKEIQIVFQDPGSSLNPRRTIGQILGLPLVLHRGLRGAAQEEAAIELLRKVELPPEYLLKSPSSIGGGEKQMVAIARALASEPSMVVLDEPTSALDVSVQAKIINKLIALQREMNLTYLFITHDLSVIRNVATRIAIMYLGRLCELAQAAEFFEQPEHPYTRMLISSVPVISDEEERLKPKKVESRGEIPSPVNIPSGCSFHPRCPERASVCSKVNPEMVLVRPGHYVRCHQFTSCWSDTKKVGEIG
ncbi:MAG TPA: ABC transporter ATP-binding protein [Firmicutes bacterium]|nr:ABC transporter ATP-binding protein [Bacillota bacterium]